MKKLKTYTLTALALGALSLAGSLTYSRGSQAKGAYSTPVTVMNTTANSVPVSPALPAQPFFQELSNQGSQLQAFGPGTGTFGITALTFTNFNNATETVRVFQPILSGGSPGICNGATVFGGGQGVRVQVPAGGTTQLTFPTPIVMTPSNSQTCGGVSFTNTDGSVYVNVVGYSN